MVAVTDRKVKLRCPFSHREFEWNRFCYVVDERTVFNGLEKSNLQFTCNSFGGRQRPPGHASSPQPVIRVTTLTGWTNAL